MKEQNNLTQRLLTAIIALPLIVGSLYWNVWGYFFLFLFLSTCTLFEFYKLLEQKGYVPLTFWGLFFSTIIYTSSFLQHLYSWPTYYNYLILLPIPWMLCVSLYKSPHEKQFTSTAYTVLGILYIGVPFAALHELAFMHITYDYALIMGFLFMFFLNDSVAYLAGRSFGKNKLFKRISPKKSWEGAIAGVLATIVFSYIWGHYYPILSQQAWVTLGCITAISSIYGDLVASFFKRSLKVKDSGNLIPGHGGFLDRFDNMLVAAPVSVVLLKLVLKT